MTDSKRYPSRMQVETLFETANPLHDPQGLVSKYTEFELFRLNRSRYEFDPRGNLGDRLKVLRWYLSAYVHHRDYAVHVPLSRSQVEFLNGPLPISGFPPAVTIAFYNAVLDELPSHANLRDPRILQAAAYWWCIQRAPHVKLDHRLVTAEQAAILQREVAHVGQPFPLTVFMVEYVNQHPELSFLDLSNARDRAALLQLLILLSFSKPYVARFLTIDSVRRVMRADAGASSSFFEQVLEQYAGAGNDHDHVATIVRQGEEVLRTSGFSLRRGWSSPITRGGNSGDCFVGGDRFGEPTEDGVALIAPIHSTSGLGQASRLSLQILKGIEALPPTTFVFAMDNPAPIGFATDMKLVPYEHRRTINLIHLNAESIPLAPAYLPSEMFSESYNIGYFFWELNKLPRCHALALDMLDEIWVSSEYNREIYAANTSLPVTNVGMAVEVLPDVEPAERAVLGIDDDSVVFLTTFDSFSFIERKNPLAVIGAFTLAFPLGTEDARLIVKTQNRTRVHDPHQLRIWSRIDLEVARDPRIVIIDETYRYRELLALKLACDCYVSLHRSEGWGFGMLEAMQLERPVICTAYSGNMDFCNDETAYLVGYELIAPVEEEYIFVERGSLWADPNREEAATQMRKVAGDREAARAKGKAAAQYIGANFSVEAIGRRYKARLTQIRAMHFTTEHEPALAS